MSTVFGTLIDLWPVTALFALALLWLAWRRLTGRLRLFAMMAAAAPIAFLLFVLLHNAAYWLSLQFWRPPGFDEPAFFILAVIVCPVALVVGLVGALLSWRRQTRALSRHV